MRCSLESLLREALRSNDDLASRAFAGFDSSQAGEMLSYLIIRRH